MREPRQHCLCLAQQHIGALFVHRQVEPADLDRAREARSI
jgi:hypothetical protein